MSRTTSIEEDRRACRALATALQALVRLNIQHGDAADWLRQELEVFSYRLGPEAKPIEAAVLELVWPRLQGECQELVPGARLTLEQTA